jgi:hypothetical protein
MLADNSEHRESADVPGRTAGCVPRTVLALYYSQTGQLKAIIDAILAPLRDARGVRVVCEEIRPVVPYPFPWPTAQFLEVFPDSYDMVPPAVEPLQADPAAEYDLVLIGYPVWYLAPALPVTGFLSTPAASRILRNRPVITVADSHGVWAMGQERMRQTLARLGADLLDHVSLSPECYDAATFLTTPRWMLTGRKDRMWGLFAPPTLPIERIRAAERFGRAIRAALEAGPIVPGKPLLAGLGAVRVDATVTGGIRITSRVFAFWARIVTRAGGPGSRGRKNALKCFGIYLVLAVSLLLPLSRLLCLLLYPFTWRIARRDRAYFEAPSGSDTSACRPEDVAHAR